MCIRFKSNVECGLRYGQFMQGLTLNGELLNSDRIKCGSIPSWNATDWVNDHWLTTDMILNHPLFDRKLNEMFHFHMADISTVVCDIIVVPVVIHGCVCDNWLLCRVIRRGGMQVMRELIANNAWTDMEIFSGKTFFVNAHGYLPCRKILFVMTDGLFINTHEMKQVFNCLESGHSCAMELPMHSIANNNKSNVLFKSLRTELQTNDIPFFLYGQSLHDLHCYSDQVIEYFPRLSTKDMNNHRRKCFYVPHCPCNKCSKRKCMYFIFLILFIIKLFLFLYQSWIGFKFEGE